MSSLSNLWKDASTEASNEEKEKKGSNFFEDSARTFSDWVNGKKPAEQEGESKGKGESELPTTPRINSADDYKRYMEDPKAYLEAQAKADEYTRQQHANKESDAKGVAKHEKDYSDIMENSGAFNFRDFGGAEGTDIKHKLKDGTITAEECTKLGAMIAAYDEVNTQNRNYHESSWAHELDSNNEHHSEENHYDTDFDGSQLTSDMLKYVSEINPEYAKAFQKGTALRSFDNKDKTNSDYAKDYFYNMTHTLKPGDMYSHYMHDVLPEYEKTQKEHQDSIGRDDRNKESAAKGALTYESIEPYMGNLTTMTFKGNSPDGCNGADALRQMQERLETGKLTEEDCFRIGMMVKIYDHTQEKARLRESSATELNTFSLNGTIKPILDWGGDKKSLEKYGVDTEYQSDKVHEFLPQYLEQMDPAYKSAFLKGSSKAGIMIMNKENEKNGLDYLGEFVTNPFYKQGRASESPAALYEEGVHSHNAEIAVGKLKDVLSMRKAEPAVEEPTLSPMKDLFKQGTENVADAIGVGIAMTTGMGMTETKNKERDIPDIETGESPETPSMETPY